jgi:hypothetical protein
MLLASSYIGQQAGLSPVHPGHTLEGRNDVQFNDLYWTVAETWQKLKIFNQLIS